MKQEFGYFLKNAKFRAALGLTLLLSYGYAIATTRVSIDSLEGDRYIGTGGVMLSTGRFGMNLWAAVLGYGRAEPSYAFGIDLLAALLLALAAVSFCALLRKAAQDRISMFGYGLFACLFASYPLMNEIWEYSGANVCVCGGYLLDAAALNLSVLPLTFAVKQPSVRMLSTSSALVTTAVCAAVSGAASSASITRVRAVSGVAAGSGAGVGSASISGSGSGAGVGSASISGSGAGGSGSAGAIAAADSAVAGSSSAANTALAMPAAIQQASSTANRRFFMYGSSFAGFPCGACLPAGSIGSIPSAVRGTRRGLLSSKRLQKRRTTDVFP